MLKPTKAATVILAAALAIGAVSVPATAAEISTAVQVKTLSTASISKVTSGSIDLSWPTVSGAWSYEVRYSDRTDFQNARVEEKFNSRTIRGLDNATTYYFQYRTLTRGPGAKSGTYSYKRSAWSETTSATTKALFPGNFTSVKASGGTDSLKVRWNKTSNTTHYTVTVADDVNLTKNKRVFRNIKGTSYTVKNLSNGSRSGMPTFVQVQAHNKGFETRTARRFTAYAAAPKLSSGETVKVASQNLMCGTCIVPGAKRAHWNTRVKIHLATIKAENPDVILIQEGLNQNLPGSKTKTMEGLDKKLKGQGYALDRKPEKAGSNQYSNRVAYKKTKFKAVKKGTFKIPNAKGEERRGAAWVLLESKKTGKRFYAVSVHVSPKLPQTGKVSMESSAKLINEKLASINKKKLPIVTGGDFNSSYYDGPNSPQTTLVKAGWTDAASSAKRTNYMRATTSQGTGSMMASTYGRIDYIMTKYIKGTVSYKNVVTTKKNKIVSLHGSDHHMVVAKIRIK
ncbi:hypothetical protein [Paeniglutamicibacter kerguelensis]|uniref:Endonuclease/exonuclease/phosphatase family metal-dependent hydrolase n=1 Tax=Paeniglutamicibacter kerguelensis TaxID=254788 RepID=A0ABS4XE08_9MICC|nr:hypothetical protein [Paeniglutamicibacter kerguelensis]MBP2385899.1 endonuclease/exonuclease/phosphatase family metal-dependent hydrolase [Paeniglutamicibacter kerguelensis]